MRLPLVLLLVLALQAPALAQASEYKSRKAGHPVRIVAYALHPVGYILDRLIFYPAWWIGQWEPVAALVGMKRTVRDVDVGLGTPQPGRHPNVMIPSERPPSEAPRSEPDSD